MKKTTFRLVMVLLAALLVFASPLVAFATDTTQPTGSISYSDATLNIGQIMTITATFNEDMTTTPAPKLAIAGANTLAATAMTKVDTTTYYYLFTGLDGEGTCTITFSVGEDTAGNLVVSTPTAGRTFQTNQVSGDYTAAVAGAVAVAVLIAATARHKRRTT